jgi:hypothetical protein
VDLERRRERADRDVEPHLVVARARAAVRDPARPDGRRDLHDLLGLHGPLRAHAHRVHAPAQAVPLDEVGDEAVVDRLLRVHRAVVADAQGSRPRFDGCELARRETAGVDAHRDDLGAGLLLQPDRAERRVEPAREGEYQSIHR